MKSKWFKLKSKATSLRRQGKSIRDVELFLGIPRSTLSGWFKNVKLTKSQMSALKKRRTEALIDARKNAVRWHNEQKNNRLKVAEKSADITLEKIKIKPEIIELSLALLYLGEGFKKGTRTGMGNSDPLLLKFFLEIITNIYKINIENIRFELHLRADQNPGELKKYWAEKLNAPLHRFGSVSIDQRTLNKPTYPEYKGVCIIDCGNIAIQRKLVYIGRKFCENVIKKSGRLAHLVERSIDVRKVTGSNPVSPTRTSRNHNEDIKYRNIVRRNGS